QPGRLDRLERDPVHARRALAGAGKRVGVAQDVRAMDLVVEQVEAVGRLRLRLAIQLPLKTPDRLGCCQAHRPSPILAFVESMPEVRALPSAGVTRPQRCRVGGGRAFALPPSARSNGSCGFPASRFPVWSSPLTG